MLKQLRSSAAGVVLLGIGLGLPAHAQSAGDNAVRLDQVEQQLRQLVGQVEELTFEVKQLKSELAARDVGVNGPAVTAPTNSPLDKPREVASQPLPASGGDIEQIGDQPISPLTDSPSSDLQSLDSPIASMNDGTVDLNKAPGPQALGSLPGTNAAARPGDGGFQGKVLVAPAQQEPGDDAGVMQANGAAIAQTNGTAVGSGLGTGDGSESVQTVALSPESPEALYERSNESLLRRQFGDAEAGFRTFLQKYPDHDLAGSAQYWLGETYYAQSDFRQAAQAFLQGYRQYPQSRRAADSLLKLGISLGRLGQQQQACAAFAAVNTEYPKAVEARKRAQSESRRAGCPS
jgi:tol-pal system protein YbgF